ncbi:MAG: nitroreductase family protein [Nostoc sp. ChiSLP02]|nr:nitroreductase family protein [Nostoc sp. DedSLP05]MDZ8187299.1 nitroreductase family protein [Nostoc sp. ChiSLP02]
MRSKLNLQRWRLTFIPKLLSNYAYDFGRFVRNSSVSVKHPATNLQVETKTQFQARMTIDYHSIEKGLAMKEPRVGFGREVIQRLLSNLPIYLKKYGFDETVQITLNALLAYYSFNLEHGFKDEQLYESILKLKQAIPTYSNSTDEGGIFKLNKKSILDDSRIDLRRFFQSRHSIRHFAPEEVDMCLIEQAVAMAQKTPSVCNRQSSKVYVFSSDEDKQKVLSYQSGNRGFGDQASKVLIVVSDLENFTLMGERNQCWIDGGMYAMSLVYALHSLGLGTCCLNWSVEYSVDKALKQVTNIKDSESIIMMIAVGHLPEELKVAQSPRKAVDEVLIVK